MQTAGQRLNMGGSSAYIDHSDAIGSTTMETDPAGGVQWKIAYYPWGQVLAQGGTRQSVVWAGLDWQVNDPSYPSATREYNDGLGRWLTPDPDGGHLENPQTLNKYTYAGNNPTSLNDPSGLDFYLLGGKDCGKDGVDCDKSGYVLGANKQRMVVTSASLSDSKSGNKATVSENGVEIAAKGLKGSYEGVFINHTPAANIQGSSELEGFAFHIENSNVERGTLDEGTFSYNGTRDQTRRALDERGAFRGLFDKRWLFGRSPDELRFHHDSTQHRFGTGPSPHFSVPDDPRNTVPTTGPFHIDRDVGAHHAACAILGVSCD
jgi:RHS repeat-associated protein